jgi:two-component system LytT family response regulator
MRIVIADSEASERATLVALCRSRGVSAELHAVESGSRALSMIRGRRPDIALLACQLDDMAGFDVLRALSEQEHPATILVATDERHVTEALSSSVAGYLVRPFSDQHFSRALHRACSHAQWKQRAQRMDAVAKAPAPAMEADDSAFESPLGFCDRLVGERAGRLYFLPAANVDFIESDGNYVQIHLGGERYLSRDSLNRLSPLLVHMGFMRINRSVLLNMRRVCFAEREGGGVLAFALESGDRVTSSAGFRLEAGAPLRVMRTRGIRR